MFCPNCGAKIRDNTRFCTQCGKPLTVSVPPQKVSAGKKKSPVLAILLLLTIAMTGVTVWYFLQPYEKMVANKAEETEYAQEIEEKEPLDVPADSADATTVDDAGLSQAREKVESEFDTVSKTSNTPTNVARLGSREKLPSGEVVGTLEDGIEAVNIWAEDEEGKLFYFGYDGCIVKNNYAPDGFFTGADGMLDESKARISGSHGGLLLDKEFVTDTSSDPLILFEKDPDSVYECLFIKRYSFGYDEVFGVIADPDSAHAYLLNPDPGIKGSFKDTKGALLTVLDDGNTLIVSDCGVTETYHVK